MKSFSLGCCSIWIEKQKPYLVMFLVQCAFAGLALLSKAAMNEGMNPYIFVAYRLAFGTALLFPFAFWFERNNAASLSFSVLLKIFSLSLFGITLSLNLYVYSMKYTSATFAAAAASTVPAMTFVIAVLLRMECVSIKKPYGMAKVVGSAIGFSGAVVFAFVKGPHIYLLNGSRDITRNASGTIRVSTHDGQWIKGSLIMLLGNMIWSLWLVMLAPAVKEYPAKLRLTTLQCLFSCIQSALFAFAMERNVSSWKLGWDINLLSVAYCGLIVTGMTYWLQLWAVEKRGPVFTAMFNPVALIITAIVSAVVWNEILCLGSVCGGILLVVGLYFVLWGKSKEATAAQLDQEFGGEKEQNSAPNKKEPEIIECITHQ